MRHRSAPVHDAKPAYAAKYGNNILCFQAVLGRHFELRAERLYDGDYRERFRILRQMHAELGVCYAYDNFDDFVDTVTGGGMYQSWCSSKLQDAVLGYLFAEGFNSVSMSETYSWGESADVMVFSDPSLLTRVREHSGPSEAPYKENLC